METALDILLLETCLLENLGVRQKVDLCSASLGLADDRQQSVLELLTRLAAGLLVLVNKSVSGDRDGHLFRECIDDT